MENTSTTKRLSISLPQDLYARVEKERHRQHSSRSEFIRNLFRLYFLDPQPPVEVTKAELKAHDEGMADYKAGRYVRITNRKQLRDELGLSSGK